MRTLFRLKHFEHVLQLIFIILFFTFILVFSIHKPRLLIIHSYDTDYQWVLDIDEGLNRILHNHPELSIDRIYMNTKNNPSKEYGERIGINVRNMVENLNPDVILAINNDAQKYVAKYYINHPNIKIVFTGINGDPENFGYENAKNVTGFLNRIPVINIKNFFSDMVKQKGHPLTIASIGDTSESAIQDTVRLHSLDWSPNILMPRQLVGTFDEWKKIFNEAQTKADMVIIHNYRQLRYKSADKKLIPFKEIVDWTNQHNKLPAIGYNGFMMFDRSVDIAIATSAYDQGEVGAKMALKVINGQDPHTMPIQEPTNFLIYINATRWEKTGLKLPQIFISFAKAIKGYIE